MPHMPTIASPSPLLNGAVASATIGQVVYLSAPSTFGLAQATTLTPSTAAGIVSDASIASGVIGNVVEYGPISLTTSQWDAVAGTSGGLTQGQAYYISATVAGNITANPTLTAGALVGFVGIAESSTVLFVAPQFPFVALGVSQDSGSLAYVPNSGAEWNQLVAGSGIGSLINLWLFQEAAFPLADSIGGAPLGGSATGNQFAQAGWTRKGVVWFDTAGAEALNQTQVTDIHSSSYTLMAYLAIGNVPSGLRGVMAIGSDTATDDVYVQIDSSAHFQISDSINTGIGAVNHGTDVVFVTIRHNLTAGTQDVFIGAPGGAVEKISKTYRAPVSSSIGVIIGHHWNPTPLLNVLWAAALAGPAAEMTDAQVATLYGRLATGP